MAERPTAAAGGLVFVGLSVAALALLPPPPDADASAATVRHHFAAHGGAVRVASTASIFAALALLPLFAALRRRLRGPAADVLFAAGVVTVTVAVIGGVLQAGLALSQARIPDAGIVGAFDTVRMVFYVAPALAMAAVAAAAATAFRDRLPGWLARGSAVLAVVAAVGGAASALSDGKAVGAIGLVGFVLTIVWVAATSIVLLREDAPALV